MNNNIKKIVIATGGTGGHIFPAYSLAKHFKYKNINVEIISDKRGYKYLKDYQDIKVSIISSSTIFKKDFFQLIFSITMIIYAITRSFIFLLFNRPNLIFGMGGYSSFPVCIAAKILRVPFIIYENNLFMGKANKYLTPFAEKVFVSYKDLEGVSQKYKENVIEIGNIIRKEILNAKLEQFHKLDDKKLKILILGGSQAAKIFAEELPKIFKKCVDANIDFKIYQQCLPDQNEFLNSYYKNLNINFEIFNFKSNIMDYFQKTNLAITRSGSSMLAELINVKVPFISIPLPSSADNHQLKNAIYYKKHNYGYLIKEEDIKTELFGLISRISKEKSLLNQMINKQRQYSDKSVYENIDKEVTKILNEKY